MLKLLAITVAGALGSLLGYAEAPQDTDTCTNTTSCTATYAKGGPGSGLSVTVVDLGSHPGVCYCNDTHACVERPQTELKCRAKYEASYEARRRSGGLPVRGRSSISGGCKKKVSDVVETNGCDTTKTVHFYKCTYISSATGCTNCQAETWVKVICGMNQCPPKNCPGS